MNKLFSVLFTFFFLSLTFTRPSFAAENFSTSYDITYTLTDSGLTHSSMNIDLVNNTSDYYASSYAVTLGFENVENLKAFDASGPLSPQVSKENGTYTVKVPFPSQVVGLNKKRSFTITFDTPDISKKQGAIWEVNIPGLSDEGSISDFVVSLSYPPSYGRPSYVKPAVAFDPNNPQRVLQFSKEQLGKSGISISFGEKQVFSFSLVYHIKNANLFPIRTEIALPPTTNYQEVVIDSISPKPLQVIIDADGNWLAQYQLSPSEKMDITVKGYGILFLTPKPQALSEKDRLQYLSQKPYWNSMDPKIAETAKNLKTPREIYNYVVNALTYDYDRVTEKRERLGAVNVLKNPSSAVCLEFTDLFIALARANGIPAREVDGFAFTENSRQRPLSLVQDILHAWPEYYDSEKKTWVMVDPTWGNTTGGVDYFDTLDFDHFAFVIKGKDSGYPIPAGGYKYAEMEAVKDIEVSFSETDPVINQSSKLSLTTPSKILSGFPIQGELMVYNTGNVLSKNEDIAIFATNLLPRKQVVTMPQIPPFGNAQASFAFEKTKFLTSLTAPITIQTQNETLRRNISVMPLYFSVEMILIGGGLFAILAIGVSVITIITRRVSVPKRE